MRANNRDETAHQPLRRRERKMQGFKSAASGQRFVSVHAAVYNVFNTQRHLNCRATLNRLRAASSSLERYDRCGSTEAGHKRAARDVG